MFRKILLVGLFSLLSGVALAQTAPMQDVVYLKNGSVIRGVIIEQVPNESLKIETRDGNVFVYRMEEITKMTKEQAPNYYGVRPRYEAKARGYMGIVEAGYGIGVGEYLDRFEVDVVNGYQFSPYFALGGGIGVNIWTRSGLVTMPYFLHLRTNFINGHVSPFLAMNVGYNLSLDANLDGGVMIEPTLGVAVRVSNRAAVIFGLSYSGQRYGEDYIDSNYATRRLTYWADAIRIKLGCTF